MYIIGAGLAGLLAANIFRKYNPTILEAQSSLPNNHTAVLRHRDCKISEATSIPFRKVKVIKAVNHHGELCTTPTPAICNEYSLKVTGKLLSRSISNLDPVYRYIAPPDFISKLAVGCKIEYGVSVDADFLTKIKRPIITTIPMPTLWWMFNSENAPEFSYKSIEVISGYITEVECDLYQTIYYTNPKLGMYRMSITGNKVMAEFIFDDFSNPNARHGVKNTDEYITHFLERDFGIRAKDVELIHSDNKYGKITNIDETSRKEFIHRMTSEHNIYSLGRFATWRNLLLDDVYEDLLEIQKLMEQRGEKL